MYILRYFMGKMDRIKLNFLSKCKLSFILKGIFVGSGEYAYFQVFGFRQYSRNSDSTNHTDRGFISLSRSVIEKIPDPLLDLFHVLKFYICLFVIYKAGV
jgi:hypothetical protein